MYKSSIIQGVLTFFLNGEMLAGGHSGLAGDFFVIFF